MVLPFQAIVGAIARIEPQRLCMHPRASSTTCNSIVAAHTVQRSGALSRLVDDSNHVLHFNPTQRDRAGLCRPCRTGWHDASTFTGFCAHHDSTTFAPIENRPFEGSGEQRFLLAYRALCYEIHEKRHSLKIRPRLQELGAQGHSSERKADLVHTYDVMDAGTRTGLDHLEKQKSRMDSELLSSDYSGWTGCTIRFAGDLVIATAGVVSPNKDLSGRPLQTLHDFSRPDQATVMCSVVPVENGLAVAFAHRQEYTASRLFVESLLAREPELPDLLVQFFFVHLGNTWFSPKWWAALSTEKETHLRRLATIAHPYYTDVEYRKLNLTNWKLVGIQYAAPDIGLGQ
jgi:hypothetical protein